MRIQTRALYLLIMMFTASLSSEAGTPQGGVIPIDLGSPTTFIRVESYATTGLGLPSGAYRVSGTPYVILRQDFKLAPGAGAFGVLGLLAQNATGTKKGKNTVAQTPEAFNFDLDAATKHALAEMTVQGVDVRLIDEQNPESEILEVTPFAWIGTYKTGQTRVHIVLEARLKDRKGKVKWWNRYINYSPETHPISGDDGWMANDGAFIKSASQAGIDSAVAVFALDLAGLTFNHDKQKARYNAPYMAFPESVTLDAVLLKQDNKTTVVETKVGWAGVNIVPSNEVSLATK